MNQSQLSKMASSLLAFLSSLVVQTRSGPAPLGSLLVGFQRQALEPLAAAFQALAAGNEPAVSKHWWEWTKGCNKTTLAAGSLLWLLIFAKRPAEIRVGAGDQQQAAEVRLVLKHVLRDNPQWQEMVEVQNWAVLNKRNEGRIVIVSSDAKTQHGGRPLVTFLDEAVHVGDEDFVDTLLANQTKLGGVTFVATNAGLLDSWAWKKRESFRTSGQWAFSVHDQPAPWISKSDLAQLAASMAPTTFQRLFYGQWSTGEGSALDPMTIENAVTLPGPYQGDWRQALRAGWACWGGLDLSLKRDRSAICFVQTQGPKIRLAYAQSWKPPIDLTVLETEILHLCQRFNPWRLMADQWQAAMLATRLSQFGVPTELVSWTAGNMQEMALVLERFHTGNVELYDSPELIRDLKQMRFIDRLTSFRVDWPRSSAGHGDLGTSFLLSCLAAYRNQHETDAIPEALADLEDDLAAHRERMRYDAAYEFTHG